MLPEERQQISAALNAACHERMPLTEEVLMRHLGPVIESMATGREPTGSRWEQATEWWVLPTGCTPASDPYEYPLFAARVVWKGPRTDTGRGGWAVLHLGSELSRAGKWKLNVAPFQQHQYRWETFTEAQKAARDIVDGLVVNGRTWAQWLDWCAQQDRRRHATGEG